MRFILRTLPRGIGFFALISLTLLFALAACGGETSDNEQSISNPQGTSRPSDVSTGSSSQSSDQIPSTGSSSRGTGASDGQNTAEDSASGPPQTPTPLPEFPDEAVDGDYDYDDDGLIEIRTLAQLDAMRLDPEGTGFVQEGRDQYFAAFPGFGGSSGCPAQNCSGYELAAHLDFDTNGNGEADAGDEYWNDGMGWEPLPGIPEGGTFDGNGYTISNLFIFVLQSQGVDGYGLFSSNHGEIRNVNLASASVQRTDRSLIGTGSLVSKNNGTVSNCSASGTVVGIAAGGLVGVNESSVVASVSSASVSGIGYRSIVGGLVGINTHGINSQGSIEGSEATGPVSDGTPYFGRSLFSTASQYTSAGGLVGENNGSILDSTASADVTGNYQAGGLVGTSRSGSISGSTASGNVSGGRLVGGLVGGFRGSISNSRATGPVSGVQGVGGLVGGMLRTAGADNSARIENSVSEGEVHGLTIVGGLVGWASEYGRIINSSSSGDVYGGMSVGGLVGANLSSINDSRASGSVNGVFNVGGLVGTNNEEHSLTRTSGSINGSSSEGRVTGGENVGGLVGFNASDSSILNSNAEGDVAGITYRGDLVGADDGGTIENSEGTGAVELNDDEDLFNEWEILSSLPEIYHPEPEYHHPGEDGIFLDHNGRVIHMAFLFETAGIPPELSSLTNLQSLILGDPEASSDLGGEIPPELGDLTNLQFLSLSGRRDLTGGIPPELGNLANLQHLRIFGYGLTSEIPPELGNLTNLRFLTLQVGELRGEIPPELGNLTNLTHLSLNLTHLSLSGNLAGEIPPELGNLTNLTHLSLWGDLTGEIPPELSNLTNLTYLDLRGDGLTGCIPDNLESQLVEAKFPDGVTFCSGPT